jgi:hypothetical protein
MLTLTNGLDRKTFRPGRPLSAVDGQMMAADEANALWKRLMAEGWYEEGHKPLPRGYTAGPQQGAMKYVGD